VLNNVHKNKNSKNPPFFLKKRLSCHRNNDVNDDVLQYDKYWKAGAFGDHIGTGPNLRETFKRCGYYMKPFTTKKNNTIRSG
jgi:hypothetical protein